MNLIFFYILIIRIIKIKIIKNGSMKNLGPDLGFKDIKKLCREEKDLMNLNIKSLATSFSD